MHRTITFFMVVCLLLANCHTQGQERPKSPADQPALTIYNANFAVVRQTIPLELKAGINRVSFTDATAHIEPDSVILRDPTGRRALQILEQNYRNDPVSQELLLSIHEGKTIDFRVQRFDAQGQMRNEIVQGKIIRSGYVPHYSAMSQYGQQYYQQQMAYAGNTSQPIIEVDGKLQFTLPGLPLFPTLGDNTILKPTLDWVLQTDKPGASEAELSYITGGMNWHADYNVVAPPKGDTIDLVGWITMDNQSGKEFNNARIKLMAGDVNKIQNPQSNRGGYAQLEMSTAAPQAPPVTEKAFDEYHLYSLERATTLHDRETKQVQFVTATGVKSQRIYVYDGLAIDSNRYGYYNYDQIRNDQNYGTQSNPKVWVMQEFKNSKANNLGMPLPKGRLRFYRRDDDGQVEFTGENTIDHTPTDETIRVYTGNAFDIVGERRRTSYKLDSRNNSLDEAFEIKVRNHKKEAVEVRVVEKLYRWITWDIQQKSDPYKKLDSKTIEFRVQIPPDGEKIITYSAHYSW
ncbi:MAG TPA: DUF4139 domain-containing protein [Candidatus Angelobacter sp.]|jgi:hypothetical protein|nr:DUF4139 domain-containing protein [Candidatus Angelobacter sp.]